MTSLEIVPIEDHPGIVLVDNRMPGGLFSIHDRPIEDHPGRLTLQTLSTTEKDNLLRVPRFEPNEGLIGGSSLLQKLRDVDPLAAQKFGLKETAVSKLPFRLITRADSGNFEEQPATPGKSFLALSYCWHSRWWNPVSSCREKYRSIVGEITPPISLHMWNAFLAELSSPEEGVWVDQLCVQQQDREEKLVAVGSMDLVYRNARLVVIVLEDIELDLQSQTALLDFVKARDARAVATLDRKTRAILIDTFWKIVSARWFSRAWCAHEFRVSHKHIFLIPVNGKAAVHTTIRLNTHTLDILSSNVVRFQAEESTLTDSFEPLPDTVQFRRMKRLTEKIISDTLSNALGTPNMEHDGSYMNMFLEVFSLGASRVTDKLQIVLNAMSSGLYFLSDHESPDDCCWMLTSVAFAAGDPMVIGNSGKAISSNIPLVTSWIWQPQSDDNIRPQLSLQIPPCSFDISMTTSGLEIDVEHLGSEKNVKGAEKCFLTEAEWFINNHDKLSRAISAASGSRLLLDQFQNDSSAYEKGQKFYTQVLACALECGVDWCIAFEEIMDKVAPILQISGRSQYDSIARGLEWISAVNLGTASSIMKFTDVEKRSIQSLLEFTENLVSVGLGITVEEGRVEWEKLHPRICETSSGKTILLTPSSMGEFDIAVPSAVIDDQYNWMRRVWFLKKPASAPEAWTLIGKTRLAGKYSIKPGKRRRILVK